MKPDHDSSWKSWWAWLESLRSERKQLVEEGIGEPLYLMIGGQELVKKKKKNIFQCKNNFLLSFLVC